MSICTGAYKVAEGFGEVITSSIRDVKRLVGSIDGLDTSLRFWADSTALRGILKATHNAASPFFQTIGVTRAVISVSRLIWSVNEVASGSISQDMQDKKTFSVIASVSFLVARTLSTVRWCMTIGLIKTEEFARHAQKIGTHPVFSRFAMHPAAIAFKNAPLIDLAFIAALSALAVNNAVGLYRGEKYAQNFFELVSLSADIALCTLGIIRDVSPLTAAALGVVAAGTGIVAFYFDPSNATKS